MYNCRGRVRFVRIPNRESKALMAVISRYCESGSVINSDGWKGYSALSELGYRHKTVIHKRKYVDPESGAHTQGIEGAWVEIKAWWRRSRGSSLRLQSHMDGIAWRIFHAEKRNSHTLLDKFLNCFGPVHG